MPIHEYVVDEAPGCDHCREPFEVMAASSDEPLAKCPACGSAVRRVFSRAAVHGAGSSRQVLSNSNLAAKGFTKYQKAADGTYQRVAGDKGPQQFGGG